MELLKYKELIWNFTLKQLKLRYRRSVLGFLWSFLNPLGMMVIYMIVFSRIYQKFNMENFSIFLLSGILPWNFFTTSLSQSTTVILENANLVKKIYFPREIFPLASVLANLVNLSLSFIPLFLLFSLLKMKLGLSIVILPVVIAIQLLFTLGLTLIIAPATVLFRDITHILEVVLLGWFFLSPIIYPKEFLIATPPLSTILRCNPMLYIIDNYHYVIYSSSFPPLESILISFISAFLSLIIGKITFKKLERRVVKKL